MAKLELNFLRCMRQWPSSNHHIWPQSCLKWNYYLSVSVYTQLSWDLTWPFIWEKLCSRLHLFWNIKNSVFGLICYFDKKECPHLSTQAKYELFFVAHSYLSNSDFHSLNVIFKSINSCCGAKHFLSIHFLEGKMVNFAFPLVCKCLLSGFVCCFSL